MEKEAKFIEDNINQIIGLIREKLEENDYMEERVIKERRSSPFIDKHIDFIKNDFIVRIKVYKIEK